MKIISSILTGWGRNYIFYFNIGELALYSQLTATCRSLSLQGALGDGGSIESLEAEEKRVSVFSIQKR